MRPVWPSLSRMSSNCWPSSAVIGQPSRTALIIGAMCPSLKMLAAQPVATAPPRWPASATWPTASTNYRSSTKRPRLTHCARGANSRPSPPPGRSSRSKLLSQNQFVLWGCGRPDPSPHTPQNEPYTPHQSAWAPHRSYKPRHADSWAGLSLGPPHAATLTPALN
jgi:hypothetical protein